jgi:hypothetical protein
MNRFRCSAGEKTDRVVYMEGWQQVLKIIGIIVCWLLALVYLGPRAKGGFS